MKIDLAPLLTSDKRPSRLLFEVDLRPVQGSRFQPTGFPDLGAAVYETVEGTRLLVESAQSMANRLEMVCWESARNALPDELSGLSYVRVEEKGTYLTSSLTEAHRLNSAYIFKSKEKRFINEFTKHVAEFGQGAVSRTKLAHLIFRYDANALIHGVFFANGDLAGGRLRVERALSAFIEAEDVQVANSGGVKNDHVNVSGETNDGFGNVLFQRDEFTARRIVAYFNLDLEEIRAFGLGADAERMLVLLALYKMRKLLDGRLRLRTACDLEVVGDGDVTAKRPSGFKLPALDALRAAMPAAVAACAPMFAGEKGVTTVEFRA